MFEEDPEFEQEAKERLREISKQINVLEAEKLELEESNKQAAATTNVDLDTIKELLNNLDELIDNSDKESIRELFLVLLEKVLVIPIPDAKVGLPGSRVEVVWK